MKQIDVCFHHVREMVNRIEVNQKHLASVHQISEILTKPIINSTSIPIRSQFLKESFI